MTADLSPAERATVDRIEQAPDALGLREEVEAVLAGHAPHVGPVSGSWTCPPPCNAMSTNGSIETGDLTGRDERAAEYRAHLADALLPIIERREAEAAKRALRDAADEMGEGDGISRFIGMDDLTAAVRAEKRAQKWLRDRADWIGGTR